MPLLSTTAKTDSLEGDYGDGHSASAPDTFYLAFFTDATMTTELTGTGGIDRVEIANTSANFTVANGTVTNAVAWTTAAATAAWASAAAYAVLMDAATDGNAWDGGALAVAKTAAVGDQLQFAAGEFTIAA